MPREDGYKNLIPMDQRSLVEARSFGAKGGRASGASRRRKRSLKAAAEYYLSLPPADRDRWNAMSMMGIEPEEIDNQMAMIVGLTEKATKGDARAAKVIVSLLGEDPKEEAPEEAGPSTLADAINEAWRRRSEDNEP